MLSRMEKSLCEIKIVATIKPRLATTTVVVSLLTSKYWFSRFRLRQFISVTKIHYWWISIFYRSPGQTKAKTAMLVSKLLE